MKIIQVTTAQQNLYSPNKKNIEKNQNTNSIKSNTVLPNYKIAFGSNPINHTNFDKLKNSLNGINLKEFIIKNTTSDKFLGQGLEAKVYAPEGHDDIVIRVKHNYVEKLKNTESPELEPIIDKFPTSNLGQKIAKIANAEILLRVPGKPHGPEHRADTLGYTIIKGLESAGEDLTNKIEKTDYESLKNKYNNHIKEDSKAHLSQLKSLAEMPSETWDKLAKDLAIFNKKGIKVDCMNPNNLMVDTKGKHLGMIDNGNTWKARENTLHDMITVTIDPFMHNSYKENLDIKAQKELDTAVSKIINECTKAAKNNNLSTDVSKHKQYLNDAGKHINLGEIFIHPYMEFAEKYKIADIKKEPCRKAL